MDSNLGLQGSWLEQNCDLVYFEENIEHQSLEIKMRLTEMDTDGRSARLGRSSPEPSRRPKSAKGRQRDRVSDYGYDGSDYGNFETQFEMERDLEGKSNF